MAPVPFLPQRTGVQHESVVTGQAHLGRTRCILPAGVQFRPGIVVDERDRTAAPEFPQTFRVAGSAIELLGGLRLHLGGSGRHGAKADAAE